VRPLSQEIITMTEFRFDDLDLREEPVSADDDASKHSRWTQLFCNSTFCATARR
jgi:hypothetical protein